MKKRFLEFVDESIVINEKETLTQLRDNFTKVFPYSDYKNLKILNSTSKGRDTLTLVCRGTVQSSTLAHNYTVLCQFHRKTLEDPWDLNAMVEIKCTCNAFRFNVAYPLFKNKNYAGTVPGNSRIPNKVQNAQQVPTFCKHIYAYLRYLIQQKVITM